MPIMVIMVIMVPPKSRRKTSSTDPSVAIPPTDLPNGQLKIRLQISFMEMHKARFKTKCNTSCNLEPGTTVALRKLSCSIQPTPKVWLPRNCKKQVCSPILGTSYAS